MKKSLIFCAVGNPIGFYPEAYDSSNHWRYTKPERLYDTVVYQYRDTIIEPDTYDHLRQAKGFKWQIAKQFLHEFDYHGYEYIGFFDDDVITDIQNVNLAIETAHHRGFKLFQMSMKAGSESSHGILRQDIGLEYSRTNFIEGMGCFFHISLIPILLDFWKLHDVKTGWGFDVLFSPITKEQGAVIHQATMFHPPANFNGYTPSYYDTSEAFDEMRHVLSVVYPKFMKHTYNEDVGHYGDAYNKVFDIKFKGM